MKLPKIAIENYQFVLILVFLALSTGLLSFFTMPRSEDPVTEFPLYIIRVVYPGTSPEDMEELIVDPIEDIINEIEDIEEIRSTIKEGVVIMRIEATYELEDYDEKYDEIIAEVNTIRDELPDELALLEFEQVSPLGTNILQLAVTSDESAYKQLIKIGEDLEDELNKVSGIRSVEVEAYPEEEIRISLDFQKMANQNIALPQVIGILRGYNANIPGGDIDADTRSFTIQTSGGYKSLDEIRNSVIGSNQGQLLYLKDIAQVNFDYEDDRFIARYQKEKCIYVSMTQKEGINIISLNDRLNQVIDQFRSELPSGIKIYTVFEQAPAVSKRINEFFQNLIQGVALVGAIILLFLGFRSALVVMTVIPTSIIMAIGTLDLNGYGLQQISIAGLVIALGLLVDNGIVVVENINRFIKEGYSPKEAAYKGTSEVGWAIVSSTVTTLLSFFPLTMLNSGAGSFLRSLPLIVIYALVSSLMLALTFTPLLSSIFLKGKPVDTEKKRKPGMITRLINFLVSKLYRPALNFSLRFPIIVLGFSIAGLVGSFALFPLVGVSLFPTADKPLILIDINTPEGTNLEKTKEAAIFVEDLLEKKDLVKNYVSNIGNGNPRIYYNRTPIILKKNHAQVVANLKYWENKSFYRLIGELRESFKTYAGAKITISELKNGPPIEAPVAIRVVGDNFDTLKVWAKKVEKIIARTEGIINVDNPSALNKTDLKVKINKDKAGMIGLPIEDIDLAVRAALTGIEVSQVNFESGDKYDMVLRIPFKEKPSIEDFEKIYIPTRNGDQVPLKQVAQLEFKASASEVLHYNLERNFTVTADVLEGYNINNVSQDVIAGLNELKFPKGYTYRVAGELEAQSDSFGGLGQILIIALVGIFAVLVLQFRSFAQPFIVFSAIPLAFVGSILALFITGWTFSFFAFVGFTSLVGIVINNSIILVDYTNQLLDRGIGIKEAIIQACETRFTPIILTTLTTIFGLTPLTLTNSGLWSPLGWTIIGGMITSTFLTLLVVPILYIWLTKPKEKLKPVIKA